MLFFTGLKRTAANVAQTYVHDLEARKRQLRVMKDLVDESLSILNSGNDLTGFGELLHESWNIKRMLSSTVSNPDVDAIYERARVSGALGGKLTGAGGGGFLLLFVPPSEQAAVRKALSDLILVPFKFEFSGSQIIFCDREEDYAEQEKARSIGPKQVFRELSMVHRA